MEMTTVFGKISKIHGQKRDTFEGYKEDLKIYAAALAAQPKPGEIAAR